MTRLWVRYLASQRSLCLLSVFTSVYVSVFTSMMNMVVLSCFDLCLRVFKQAVVAVVLQVVARVLQGLFLWSGWLDGFAEDC